MVSIHQKIIDRLTLLRRLVITILTIEEEEEEEEEEIHTLTHLRGTLMEEAETIITGIILLEILTTRITLTLALTREDLTIITNNHLTPQVLPLHLHLTISHQVPQILSLRCWNLPAQVPRLQYL
jgi:hypothetical protein